MGTSSLVSDQIINLTQIIRPFHPLNKDCLFISSRMPLLAVTTVMKSAGCSNTGLGFGS